MKYIFSFCLVFFFSTVKAQVIGVDISDTSKYSLSLIETRAKSKKCYIVNLIQKQPTTIGGTDILPLFVFKIFTDSFYIDKESDAKSVSFSSIADSAVQFLYHDMFYTVTDFKRQDASVKVSDYQLLFDDLIIKAKSHTYTFKGSVLYQFFNLKNYTQYNAAQINRTLINTNAPLVKYATDKRYLPDTIPTIDYATKSNRIEFQKINLIKKTSGTYTFCRLMIGGFDDISHRTELFTYQTKIGIIGFKSSYIYSIENRNLISLGLRYSHDYYDFKFYRFITVSQL